MKNGDIVECIDGTFVSRRTDPFRADDLALPKYGHCYTIRQVVCTPHGQGLLLEEIVNPIYSHDVGGYQEPIFDTLRFRIIVSSSIVVDADVELAPPVAEKVSRATKSHD